MHPIKKLGTPEQVGELCAFLASDAASFITGTTILMDGGRSAIMQG
jgi:NAD(P)-dependent dehydrogenase (short-subunit alcohol dehydrogenase family)